MADPISRPPSARTQMLYCIGAGQSHHLDALHVHSPFPEPLDFDGHHMSEHVFYHDQKAPGMICPPFGMVPSQDRYQHDPPKSENSSQSGDTFSACYTDEPYSQAVHHRHSISSPTIMHEPYFGYPPLAQSLQMPPASGGGISLGVVQNFEDPAFAERSQEFQDSAYSELDAEGESDEEYEPAVVAPEPKVERSPRHERVHHRPTVPESVHDSMSEDFDAKEEEDDDDYNPRRASVTRSRRASAGRKGSQGRRP